MSTDITLEKFRGWAEESLLLLRQLLPLMSPVATYEKWSVAERMDLGALLSACARTSESAVLLVAYKQLWDAEILVRSVAEGSLKFSYLLQKHESFNQRYQEYSHDLWKIALLKDHGKATELLSVLHDRDDPKWRPIRDRLLPAEERNQISDEFARAARRTLDGRWGFSGIMNDLIRSGDEAFTNCACLAFGYSLASHIHHADHLGTSLPLERAARSPDRQDAIELAHGIRLLHDTFVFLHLRLLIGYRFIGHDRALVASAWTRVENLFKSFGPIYENWMAIEYPR
jgi:hypothetical protein